MGAETDLRLLAQLGEAFNREGFGGVLPFVRPEFEFHEPPEQPGATVFRGIAEARAGFAGWSENWEEQMSDFQDMQMLPDGRVLAMTRERLRGRDGLEVENDCGHLFTFRDGKVLRWQVFWDRANARQAAGLS